MMIKPKRKAANSGPAAASESKCKRAKKAQLHVREDWSELLWKAAEHAQPAQPAERPIPIEDQETPGASSGAASGVCGSEHDPPAPPEEGGEAETALVSSAAANEVPAQPVERAASPAKRPEASSEARNEIWVECCKVASDSWGVLGQPGSYRRYKVKCPVHQKCETSRSFSDRLAKPSGLGDQEPLFFLAVWLKRAVDYTTTAEHKKFKPTPEDTIAYAGEVVLSAGQASAGASA